MTQQPPVPRPPAEDSGSGPPAPYLLAVTAGDGVPGAIAWPSGQPAWAIPVSLPPGTLGYAVFLPLVAASESSPATPTVQTAAPAAAGATTADRQAEVAGPAETGGVVGVAGAVKVAEPAEGDGAAKVGGTGSTTDGSSTAPARKRPAPAATDAGDDAVPARPAPATTTASGAAPRPAPTPVTGASGETIDDHREFLAAAPGWPYPSYPGAAGAFQRPIRTEPSFLQRYWPGPKSAGGRAVPVAVLVGALGMAFFVPLDSTGIGWFLGWLALTVAVVFAVRRAVAELPRTERWVRAGWAVAALALLAVPAFRNAWWLVTFCVLAALGCAALGVVGGQRIRSILFSLVAVPTAAFRGLPWVRAHFRSGTDPALLRRVVGSATATIAALVVFGTLLASADGAFSVLLGRIVPEVGVSTVFRWIFLATVGALAVVAAVWTLSAPPDLSAVDRPTRRSLGMTEWAPAITALTLLFGGFVAVQFTVLFGGERHVLRTAGLSYAEYARSGFWQLVAVTLLTLALLAGVGRWARRDSRTEQLVLRVLLGTLSVLSVVIVISALSRMYTYQKVYSFTGERLFVMAFELLLGSVFLMILVAGLRLRGTWIPRATVALAVTMLIGLAVLNPEGYAAGRNIDRYQESGRIDAWYLRALSADATPALADLPDPVRRCTLSWIAEELDEPDPWYAWNLGRLRARQALDRAGPEAVGGARDCRAADQFDLPKTRSPR